MLGAAEFHRIRAPLFFITPKRRAFSADLTIRAPIPICAREQVERRRQEEHVDFIASENYSIRWFAEAQGSVLTNNTRRLSRQSHYGGCEYVDVGRALSIAAPSISSRRLRQRAPHS